jgi:hypothetical protein
MEVLQLHGKTNDGQVWAKDRVEWRFFFYGMTFLKRSPLDLETSQKSVVLHQHGDPLNTGALHSAPHAAVYGRGV